MNEPPKLQDYMLPVLTLFADGEEHIYKEIPTFLEARYVLLEADKPNRARVMINNAIGSYELWRDAREQFDLYQSIQSIENRGCAHSTGRRS